MKRIPQLDGVRGVAIILVLIWHYFYCQIVTEPHSIPAKLVQLTSLSWSGVDLFFVLSGFLIAGILMDHRDAANFFRVFYFRRICRIAPLYYLLVATFVLLMSSQLASDPSFSWLFDAPLPIWAYATFTQNIFMGIRGYLGANWLNMTWSLAVEEQFYLVVPVLIYFLPRRLLIGFLILAILAAPVLRWITPGLQAFVDTPWRSDSILSGALLAILVRKASFVALVRERKASLLICLGALLMGAAVMTVFPDAFGPFRHSWLAGLYATFILVAFTRDEPFLDRVLGSRILVWFGQLSYGIYMFHQAVSGLVHGFFGESDPMIRTPYEAALTIGSLGATLLLATLSFRFFEAPLLRVGHKAKYSQRAREVAAALDAPSLGK